MARDFGPFPTKPMYEVVNRRMQRALALAGGSATGFTESGQGAVTAGTGAELVIAAYPDGALVDGLYVENAESEAVTLTTNTGSTNPRIDRLVMRLDMAAETIAPFQIEGTPATSPQPPLLVQNSAGYDPQTATTYDLPLCRYTFPGSASAQNPGSIVDERQYLFGAGAATLALTPLSGWAAESESAGAYGAPTARLMPWGEVRLAGMIRRPTQASQTAGAGLLNAFTDSLPSALRPAGGQARHLGTARTTSGDAEIYLRPEANPATGAPAYALLYSFQQPTTVYQTGGWYISLNSLSYFL